MSDEPQDFNDEETEPSLPDINIDQLRKAAEDLIKFLPPLIEQYNHLKGLVFRSPDEELLMANTGKTILELLPMVSFIKDFFGERAYKQALAIYYHANELAARGNADALKVVADLKPLLGASLLDDLENN